MGSDGKPTCPRCAKPIHDTAYWAEKAQQQAEFDAAIATLKAEVFRPFEIVLNWLIRILGRRS